jgi:hypothetical protein
MNFTKLYLPIVLALLGFLLTTRTFIFWLDKKSPFVGLLVYYTILLVTLFVMSYLGLVVAGIEFKNFRQLIGSLMIIFAFFIVVDWESCYINHVTRGHCKDVSNIYLSAEDGATYYLWSKFVNNPEKLRILTYVVTPFVLSLVGSFLIVGKVTLSPF